MGLGRKRRPALAEIPALRAERIRLFRHLGLDPE